MALRFTDDLAAMHSHLIRSDNQSTVAALRYGGRLRQRQPLHKGRGTFPSPRGLVHIGLDDFKR